jgi:hypothetical protein
MGKRLRNRFSYPSIYGFPLKTATAGRRNDLGHPSRAVEPTNVVFGLLQSCMHRSNQEDGAADQAIPVRSHVLSRRLHRDVSTAEAKSNSDHSLVARLVPST